MGGVAGWGWGGASGRRGGSGPGQTTACDRSRPETTLRHAGRRAGSRPAIHSFSARLTLSAHRFRSVVLPARTELLHYHGRGGGGQGHRKGEDCRLGSIRPDELLHCECLCIIVRAFFVPLFSYPLPPCSQERGSGRKVAIGPLIIPSVRFASHAV